MEAVPGSNIFPFKFITRKQSKDSRSTKGSCKLLVLISLSAPIILRKASVFLTSCLVSNESTRYYGLVRNFGWLLNCCALKQQDGRSDFEVSMLKAKTLLAADGSRQPSVVLGTRVIIAQWTGMMTKS